MSNPCLTRAPSPRPHRPHTHTALTASSVSSYQIQRKGTAATPTTFPRGPRLHFSNFFFFETPHRQPWRPVSNSTFPRTDGALTGANCPPRDGG